jgi:hypothetical protein
MVKCKKKLSEIWKEEEAEKKAEWVNIDDEM